MYIVAARYTIKEGSENAFIDILRKMIPISRAKPGCRFYSVNESTEIPASYCYTSNMSTRPGTKPT